MLIFNDCLYRQLQSRIRKKVINGIEYFYESSYYYSPVKKRMMEHSRYVGKNVDGRPVRVRELLPGYAFSYGEFVPLLRVIDNLGIRNIMMKHVSESEVNSILAVAMNRVIRRLPLSNIRSWYEDSYVSIDHKASLSSQNLSSLMEKIDRIDLRWKFLSEFSGLSGRNPTLLYDITSISSYGKMPFLEYGYSRDNTEEPQVNLSMAVDSERNVPVFYEVYPGSIVDVSTLHNTVDLLSDMGIRECTWVLDRCFFSSQNVDDLVERRMKFVMAVPASNSSCSILLSRAHSMLGINDLHLYGRRSIFVKGVAVDAGTRKLRAYLFHDQERESLEKEKFLVRLQSDMEYLQSLRIYSGTSLESILSRVTTARFIRARMSGDRVVALPRKNAIARHINRMGRFVIAYQGEFDWNTVLSMYRSRDAVEKSFDYLKNDIGGDLRGKSISTVRGSIFIDFVSLAIRMHLMSMMNESGLWKTYSVDSMLIEMQKIRKVRLSDNRFVTTEITKRCRKIIEELGLTTA